MRTCVQLKLTLWDQDEFRISRNEHKTRLDNGKICKDLNTCRVVFARNEEVVFVSIMAMSL